MIPIGSHPSCHKQQYLSKCSILVIQYILTFRYNVFLYASKAMLIRSIRFYSQNVNLGVSKIFHIGMCEYINWLIIVPL